MIPIRSWKSRSILHKASLALLRHRISTTRSTLASSVDRQISSTHDQLQSSLSPADYKKIQQLTLSSSDHAFKTSRNHQVKKFLKITKRKPPTQAMGSPISPRPHTPTPGMGSSISLRPQISSPMKCSVPSNLLHTKPHLCSKESFTSHTVVNLSQRTLSVDETNVLSSGMNYSLVPQSSPVVDIIYNAPNPPSTVLTSLRPMQVHQALPKHIPAKPNISRQDRTAIKSLRQGKSILHCL